MEETLKITKKAKVNPLNQPPRHERVFSIAFYIALCYVLNYLAISIVMNIIMLASGDMQTFSRGDFACPMVFVGGYFFFEALAPLSFVLGYVMLEAITRRFLPVVETYTFDRQRIRIKLVTFHSKLIKSVVVAMDLLHITWTIYM